MTKKWVFNFFFISVVLIFLGGLVNFIFDPLQQYRQAEFYKPYYLNERYMNPGIAKNYNYNSVIVGSSMVENFRLSEVENILEFKKAIKLSIAGASAYELKLTMDIVNETHKIKDVLYGLDIYSFFGDANRTTHPLPMYLYDHEILNDFKYLLSLDAMKEMGKFIVAQRFKNNDPKLNMDTMYQWQHLYNNHFGIKYVLENWNTLKKVSNQNEYKFEKFVNSFEQNFLPLLEKFPDTNFYLFYPPYSILAYKDMENNAWFDEVLNFKNYIYMATRKYKNIKIYDFQVAFEIVNNLDNYRDITHYHQKINTWILTQIKDDNYLVDSINIVKENNKKMKNNLKAYIIPTLMEKDK